MFIDWDGNGRSDDFFDDLMDYELMKDAARHHGGGGGNGRGCCGVCCLYLLLVPEGGIALVAGLLRLLH